MAVATRNSHVARAMEFFKRNDKYFAIGQTTPWDNETAPPAPSTSTYDISGLIGLRRVDNSYLVVPDPKGSIEYRGSNWKVVTERLETKLATAVAAGSYSIKLTDLLGITVGSKLRVAKTYEGVVTSVDGASNIVVLDTMSPDDLELGAIVEGGALIEGARWCYVDTYLRYDEFPLMTYRQLGIYTATEPSNVATMLSASYSTSGKDEFERLGILEVLDNRKPTPRDADQKELIALIIEF